jgi:hypothetical protein
MSGSGATTTKQSSASLLRRFIETEEAEEIKWNWL